MAQLRITELLKERGHTPYWLAKETDISYPVLWKLVNGKMQALRFDYIDKICAALNCTPGDLIVLSNGRKKSGRGK
jgi:putative transcriptional regulator